MSEGEARDWTEDFAHENGNYQNTCQSGVLGGCGKTFLGHKRRVICKACSQQSAKLGAMLEAARDKVDNMTLTELALMHADQSASFIRGEFPESADAFLAQNHLHVLATALRSTEAALAALSAEHLHCAGHTDQMALELEAANDRATTAEAMLAAMAAAKHIDDYHEDFGHVLWWTNPVEEPPYCGTPDCSDWPGYHEWWTQKPLVPVFPATLTSSQEAG